jgi:hypothetical protein
LLGGGNLVENDRVTDAGSLGRRRAPKASFRRCNPSL